jgi:hypothetical protein
MCLGRRLLPHLFVVYRSFHFSLAALAAVHAAIHKATGQNKSTVKNYNNNVDTESGIKEYAPMKQKSILIPDDLHADIKRISKTTGIKLGRLAEGYLRHGVMSHTINESIKKRGRK